MMFSYSVLYIENCACIDFRVKECSCGHFSCVYYENLNIKINFSGNSGIDRKGICDKGI